MPYARRRRARTRTPLKRRRRRPKARVRRALAIGGPRKEIVKLRYSGIACLDVSSTGAASHIFQANSMYDPDHTGVGHQPRGFDQYMTRFDHYTVLGAKIKAEFVNRQTTTQGVVVACTLQDDNTVITSLDDLMEYPKKRHQIVTNDTPEAKFTQSYSCRKFFGGIKPLTDPNQRGSIITNPAEGAFFGVYAHTMDNQIGSGCMDLMVTIDFIVAFTEPKQPAKS